MKRLRLCVLCIILVLTNVIFPSLVFAENPISVYLDGEKIEFTTNPVLSNGTTLVPFRAIFEKLGLRVTWDEKNQRIFGDNFGDKDDLLIVLQIGNKIATVNGIDTELPVAPKIVNGSTLVPLRFVAEASGKKVEWDNATKTVKIGDDITSNKNLNQEYIFALTDEEIKEAINEGKKGVQHVLDYESVHYKLVPNKSVYNMFSDVQLLTPYHYIMRLSAMEASKYKDFSFEEAKKTAEDFQFGGRLTFEVRSYGNSIDSHKNKHFVIKQGDRIIQPYSIDGLDDFGNITDSWPDFPAYIALINVHFSTEINELLDLENIDFSKKAEFIVIHAPGQESVYEIDFSNFK